MNKYKKLAMNTMIFAIGSFGSKILVFLLTYLYTSNISPADSSTKELLEITANFLIPVFTFSMNEAIIRFGLDRNYSKRQVFTSACCMTGLGLVLMLIISPLLGLITFLDYLDGYTILLLVYICTSSFRSLCSQFVRARGMVKLFSFDGILTTLTLFIFNIVFIAGLDMGVKGFLLSVILSDFLSAVFLFFVAKLYEFLNIRYFSPKLAKSMLKFSVPLIPTAVMWIITGFSDRLFIRYMESSSDKIVLGEAAAGIYGYATKIPNLISMVSTIFFQAWNMSAITENNSADRSRFYEKVYGAYQSIMFIAAAFLVAGVQIITPFVVNPDVFPEYAEVYIYTPLLVAAVLFMCFNQFLSSIYTATKHTKNSFWTSLIACTANIILNIILIPKLGIQGASIATLASYFICYCIRIVDARRYVPFRVNNGKFILNTLVLLGLCAVVIAQPLYYPAYLVCGFLFVVVCNYQAIIVMLKKLLKRG
ncbi:MAG: polysaccharide biosynthesis C-terminal domain-containing protein [Ruminococcus sp.]|nr:polysaccharide biosynthesis C-terminal domain-containing protein [Ruminococcus sp.]